MRKTVVPLLKNSLFALFLLLVSPLFFSSVATGQVAEPCDCEKIIPKSGFLISLEFGPPSPGHPFAGCCYAVNWLGDFKNVCSSAIIGVSYKLINPPPCLQVSWNTNYLGMPLGSVNPSAEPLPKFLTVPILPGGSIFAGRDVLHICQDPIIDDDFTTILPEIKCPCGAPLELEVNVLFQNGSTCVLNRKGTLFGERDNGTVEGDKSCCIDVSKVLEDKNSEFGMTLSPNPTHSNVTVQYNLSIFDKNKLTVRIYDLQSQLVKQQYIMRSTNNTFSVDIENLPTGIYLLSLQSENDELLGLKSFTVSR